MFKNRLYHPGDEINKEEPGDNWSWSATPALWGATSSFLHKEERDREKVGDKEEALSVM